MVIERRDGLHDGKTRGLPVRFVGIPKYREKIHGHHKVRHKHTSWVSNTYIVFLFYASCILLLLVIAICPLFEFSSLFTRYYGAYCILSDRSRHCDDKRDGGVNEFQRLIRKKQSLQFTYARSMLTRQSWGSLSLSLLSGVNSWCKVLIRRQRCLITNNIDLPNVIHYSMHVEWIVRELLQKHLQHKTINCTLAGDCVSV